MKHMKNIALRYAALIADTLCVLVGPLLLFLTPQQNIAENTALATAAVITMILTLLLFMTELISMLTIEESTYHTVLISGSILLYMLSSPDMGALYDIYGLHHPIWLHEVLCETAFLGLILSFFNFLHFTYRPNGKKIRFAPIICMTLADAVGYTILAFFGLQAIAHALLVLAVIIYFINFAAKCAQSGTENVNFFLSQIVLFAALGMHTVNVLYFSGIFAHAGWYSLVYIWIGMFCFISIYAAFIIREAGIAQQAKKLRRRAAALESRVLFGQIKPHFIFNALTTIKSMYHGGVAGGDETLNLFSAYLRNSMSMLDEDLIPLEKELSFVDQYVNFCNVGQKNKICMLYDIDFTDFSVPAFSIQPFVENAVKYSHVDEKEDGCIIISAHACENGAILKISDNGIGFDVSSVRKGAHGIKNACERFRLLLGADPIIESAPSKGTSITIHIVRQIPAEAESLCGLRS